MTTIYTMTRTSIAIIILSILMIGLQYFGFRIEYFKLGTIMLNLNILVSFVLVIILIKSLISIIKNKNMKLLSPFLLGLITIGIISFEPFNYTEHSIFTANSNSDKNPNSDTIGIKNGDIIFQTSLSEQSKAIQLATKSKYSHCGLISKVGNDFYVFEAIQPVKYTHFDKWINRGQNGKYVIKRLKNADQVLIPSTLKKMKQIAEQFNGKNYDLTFEWSDEKIYCSELIWKIYQRATGIEIGKLEKLSDFDLTNEIVKKKIKERYGDKIPTEEVVISPAAIFESEFLTIVKSN